MITQLLNIDKPKPRKYATKKEAIKVLSKEAKANWTKKHLKSFLSDCNIGQ